MSPYLSKSSPHDKISELTDTVNQMANEIKNLKKKHHKDSKNVENAVMQLEK